jgi:hypothetical protein
MAAILGAPIFSCNLSLVLKILNSRCPDNAFEAPDWIETALESLVPDGDDAASNPEAELTDAKLKKIDDALQPGAVSVDDTLRVLTAAPSDSNDGIVGTAASCDVVADGMRVLQVVVEGLRLRLSLPVQSGERLVVRRER